MLKKRIFVYNSLLLLALIGFVTVASIIMVLHNHRLSAQQVYSTVSTVMAEGLERLLLWDDRIAIYEMITREMQAHDMLEYIFITHDSQVYISTLNTPVPEELQNLPATTKINNTSIFVFEDAHGDTLYDFATPIGDTGATLRLGLNRTRLDKDTSSHLNAGSHIFSFKIINLIAILVGLLLSYWIARRATKEITLLSNAIYTYNHVDDKIQLSEIEAINDASGLAKAFSKLASERRHDKLALQRSHDLMKYVLEHTSSSIAVLDHKLRYLYVSRRYLKDYEIDFSDIIGMSVEEVFPELNLKWQKILQQALLGEIQKADEDTYQRKDGTVGWTKWECRPWFHSEDTIAGIIIYLEIITDRKVAELALQEREEHYRQLFDQANEGLFIMGQDWKLVEVNQTFADMHGYTVEELKRMDIRDLDLDEDVINRPQMHAQLQRGEIVRFEARHRHKEGHVIYLAVTLSIITISNNAYFLAFHQDISERKHLESRLQQTQKLESIGTLAGGIAHDFNNLLTPIIGLSEILLEDLPKGSLEHDNIREIHTAAKRAVNLVRQILSFSRKNSQEKLPVRILEIVEEAVQLARATIPSNIEIITTLRNGTCVVMADPAQLHQIIMNLITNAYHAVEESGGTISIGLQRERFFKSPEDALQEVSDRYVSISISDTGTGIDPAVHKHIFEPYFTTKKQGKGTGLGLSVVYGIVKEHGGDIQVESTPGKGTTVTVIFPLIESDEEFVTVTPPPISPTGNERLLLVDDEESVLKLERQILEKLGYHVTAKERSVEALALFQAQPNDFDLVITDLFMPRITGEQLAREIISIRADIPIILCTGFSDTLDNEKMRKQGIKGILLKPPTKADLARIVRDVLDDSHPI